MNDSKTPPPGGSEWFWDLLIPAGIILLLTLGGLLPEILR